MSVPTEVIDEIMDIFTFADPADERMVRSEVTKVLEKYWYQAILMPDTREPWEM